MDYIAQFRVMNPHLNRQQKPDYCTALSKIYMRCLNHKSTHETIESGCNNSMFWELISLLYNSIAKVISTDIQSKHFLIDFERVNSCSCTLRHCEQFLLVYHINVIHEFSLLYSNVGKPKILNLSEYVLPLKQGSIRVALR